MLEINSDTCNVCRLNYYMNEVGQCIKSTKYEADLVGSNSFLLFLSYAVLSLF